MDPAIPNARELESCPLLPVRYKEQALGIAAQQKPLYRVCAVWGRLRSSP